VLNAVSPARETLVSKTIPGILSCEGVDAEEAGSAPSASSSINEKAVGITVAGEEKKSGD
jgi:hypothetical protein